MPRPPPGRSRDPRAEETFAGGRHLHWTLAESGRCDDCHRGGVAVNVLHVGARDGGPATCPLVALCTECLARGLDFDAASTWAHRGPTIGEYLADADG